MRTALLCRHGRVFPCRRCIWNARLRDLWYAIVWVVACILACGGTAALVVAALSVPAHCQGTYCGPCQPIGSVRRCPYGCACYSDGFCHSYDEAQR